MQAKNNRMISVRFQGKPFNIIVIQVHAPTSNAEEAEQFYEDLQDLLELTPQRDVLFIMGDWNAKVRSQKIPGVADKFGLGVQNHHIIYTVNSHYVFCPLTLSAAGKKNVYKVRKM